MIGARDSRTELALFHEKARALRERAGAASSPLDRSRLEEAARRFEQVGSEIAHGERISATSAAVE